MHRFIFYLLLGSRLAFGGPPVIWNGNDALFLNSGKLIVPGLQTAGGICYDDGIKVQVTPPGTPGYFLQSNGNLAPIWTQVSANSGSIIAQNSPGSPFSVSANSTFIPMTGTQRQLWFLNTAGGAVTVTASPQIAAGTIVGQELYLRGTSATNYPIFSSSSGLDLNGPCFITNNQSLYLVWDGTQWFEVSRRS